MANDYSFVPAFGQVKVDQIFEGRMSTVISMLPTSLQSRMRPIRFLRRSISLHSLRPDALELSSSRKPRPLSEPDVQALGQDPMVQEMQDQDDSLPCAGSKTGSPQTIRRVLYSEPTEDEHTARAASGVHWKFARQGANLVSISVDGGPAVAGEDVTFERKAFIDGVTYLLKGLPHDLEPSEIDRIRSVMPEGIAIPSDVVTVQRQTGSPQPGPSQPRSLLHRGVQVAVVNVIIIFSFLLPYFMYLLRYIARTERKYKVSESLVGHGMDLVSAVGKQGIYITESIGQMNDGKVRQGLLEVLTWTVDSVTSGISEGVGEGLSIVGARSTAAM